jgi:putative tricarboxylic transport membrane protein
VSAGWLWLETRRKKPVVVEAAPEPKPGSEESRHHYYVLACVAGWMALYFAVLEPVGFLLTTPVFLFALMAYLNRGKWIANGASSVLFSVGAYYLFTKVLGVSLAAGILGH